MIQYLSQSDRYIIILKFIFNQNLQCKTSSFFLILSKTYMRRIFTLIPVFLIFSLAQTSPNNDKTRWIDATQCSISYRGQNSNITFLRCTSSDSQTYNWISCKILCCLNSNQISNELSEESIYSCYGEESSEEDGLNSAQLGLIVIASTIFGIIALCCMLKIFCRQKERRVQNSIANILPQKLVQQNRLNQQMQYLKWIKRKNPQNYIEFQTSICSICLDENTPVQLPCGHQFHLKCIGTWLKKRAACPACRSFDIDVVKINCRGCFKYMKCPREFVTKRREEISENCENCINQSEEPSFYPVINFGRKISEQLMFESDSITQMK